MRRPVLIGTVVGLMCFLGLAATGLLEEGWVDVAAMRERGPWLEESFEMPVEVVRGEQQPAPPTPVA